jgi:hypothetical protein
MIESIVSWLLHESALNQSLAAKSASNLIVICYFIAYLLNRKAIFIIVFFITELVSYSVIGDLLTNEMYYLVFAGVYSGLYHYTVNVKSNIKTVIACGIIVIFNTIAAGDAYFYPQIETVFYKSYEFLAVGVHLYLISTVVNWKILRRTMGQVINGFTNYMGVDYTVSYFWYNLFIHNKQA